MTAVGGLSTRSEQLGPDCWGRDAEKWMAMSSLGRT